MPNLCVIATAEISLFMLKYCFICIFKLIYFFHKFSGRKLKALLVFYVPYLPLSPSLLISQIFVKCLLWMRHRGLTLTPHILLLPSLPCPIPLPIGLSQASHAGSSPMLSNMILPGTFLFLEYTYSMFPPNGFLLIVQDSTQGLPPHWSLSFPPAHFTTLSPLRLFDVLDAPKSITSLVFKFCLYSLGLWPSWEQRPWRARAWWYSF